MGAQTMAHQKVIKSRSTLVRLFLVEISNKPLKKLRLRNLLKIKTFPASKLNSKSRSRSRRNSKSINRVLFQS